MTVSPKQAWLAGGILVSVLVVLPNLGKGWESLRYVTDAIPTAYSAQHQAEQVSDEFRTYLQAQQQTLIEQQSYNKALLTLQQQQAQQLQQQVNAPPPTGLREWDGTTERFWCCPWTDRDACFAQSQWRRCD